MSALGASAEAGLSGDFDLLVHASALDEDDGPFDSEDEIYAQIRLYDASRRQTFYYYSNELSHEY